MKIHMSEKEETLYRSALSKCRSYIEFGMGGSTVAAALTVEGPVYSIESDRDWIAKIELEIPKSLYTRKLIFADIGPTGKWGKPLQSPPQVNYNNYHTGVWAEINRTFDLYFIDGRFRVACTLACVLRSNFDSVFAIHDYRVRKSYHIVEEFLRPIAEAENLTLFVRRPDIDFQKLVIKLDTYQNIPD